MKHRLTLNPKSILCILALLIVLTFKNQILFLSLQLVIDFASIRHHDLSKQLSIYQKSGVDANQSYQINNASKEEKSYLIIESTEHLSILTVKYLLENGANPNIQKSPSGETALLIAVDKSGSELCALLLKYNADPNLKNSSGLSPLALAQQIHNKSVLDVFSKNLPELRQNR